jgi:serine phosphatase RsbU (regulator of sigma subunit)
MLTSNNYIEAEVKKLNADSFIVFKPKDIVSGDFYWFYVDGKILYYITADSTGHGVPGGFMSMLGINQLSEKPMMVTLWMAWMLLFAKLILRNNY